MSNIMFQISLVCVLISVAAIFAGAIQRSIVPTSHRVCYLDGLLLQASAYVPANGTNGGDLCPYCSPNNEMLIAAVCHNDTLGFCDGLNDTLTCKEAFPGIGSGAFVGDLFYCMAYGGSVNATCA